MFPRPEGLLPIIINNIDIFPKEFVKAHDDVLIP